MMFIPHKLERVDLGVGDPFSCPACYTQFDSQAAAGSTVKCPRCHHDIALEVIAVLARQSRVVTPGVGQ